MDILFTLEELPLVARQFLDALGPQKIIALYGEMGAGKTTFTHALAQAIGVYGHVASPTFSLVNEYRTKEGKVIYHMDWYRLKDESEALQAGMEEYLYSGNLCLVEWPGRAPGLLPPETVEVLLEVVDQGTRRLTVR
jgi:tRNA threonylcarbamoyladenosine biosynthesis protein TsaE